jgi:hypothetical protein
VKQIKPFFFFLVNKNFGELFSESPGARAGALRITGIRSRSQSWSFKNNWNP